MNATTRNQRILTMSQGPKDRMVRAEKRLMAPCCYTQTIDVHMSEVAEQMRMEVAQMVLSGLTAEAIYAHYKGLYGEQILAVPDGLLGELAFVIPMTYSAVAAGILSFVLYKVHCRRIAIAKLPAHPNALLDAKGQAIRDEIRRATAW